MANCYIFKKKIKNNKMELTQAYRILIFRCNLEVFDKNKRLNIENTLTIPKKFRDKIFTQ